MTKLEAKTFSELGAQERRDIQEWIAGSPDILGEDLLIIAKEHELPTRIRLDLLAIDRDAKLVIIELKRDDSGKGVEWQSIKYASYCASLSIEGVVELLRVYESIDLEEAREKISNFIVNDIEDLNKDQRIILVAKEFHSDVVSAVLWLRDYEIDVRCIRLRPYANSDDWFISPEIIIPLPEAKDYIERKERRKNELRVGDSVRAIYSADVGDFNDHQLEELLNSSLRRSSNMIPRFIGVIKTLLSEDKCFGREELKLALFKDGYAADIGRAGAYLSNISQFITKSNNRHLRQIISFESDGGAGAVKDKFYINHRYRELARRVVDRISPRDDESHGDG